MAGGAPEARTIREMVIPQLEAAGWGAGTREEEYPITDPALRVTAGRVREGRPLRADFALLHGPHPVAVVEAKHSGRSIHDGIQQAERYAARLDVPIAYATNGRKIIEIDLHDQRREEVDRFRSPEELWARFRAAKGLDSELSMDFFATPYSRAVIDVRGKPKTLRYYQHVAVQRLLRGIAEGDRRLLAVLATGSGKTAVAAQLVHVLWQNNWPRGPDNRDSLPRALYLADRDVLVAQPDREWFTPIFGAEPIARIRGRAQRSRHIYFALYQAMDTGGDREELFRQYPPDWFDLIIVDECHRGSASTDSAWREVLEHFSPAVQIGLTATPVYAAERGVDTLGYFGEPVYTYSLRQGIEDGFLAPFEVLRVSLDRDIFGVDIPAGTLDTEGRPVPEGHYDTHDFERRLVLRERVMAMARYVSEFLRRGRPLRGLPPELRKTIIFCVNQNHAGDMRIAIANLNSDLMRQHGQKWTARITSDEGDLGRELLEDFSREDVDLPVVVTTSRLLSTGVDVPTAHVIVLCRPIGSMVEFKQIIGRGTRLAKEQGKEFFTIIDFVGATRLFDDPEFDGPPIRVIDQDGTDDDTPEPPDEYDPIVDDEEPEVAEPDPPYDPADGPDGVLPPVIDDPDEIDRIRGASSDPRHTVEGYDVRVAGEALYVVEDDGRRLRPVRYEQWVRDRVRAMDLDEESLRAQWATVAGRGELRKMLKDSLAFDVDVLAERLRRPDCDPIDLLIGLAWDVPSMTRAQRADRFSREQRAFLDRYSEQAREVLALIVERFAAHGTAELDPRVLRSPTLQRLGSPSELARRFGGPPQLHEAIDELGKRLFDVG